MSLESVLDVIAEARAAERGGDHARLIELIAKAHAECVATRDAREANVRDAFGAVRRYARDFIARTLALANEARVGDRETRCRNVWVLRALAHDAMRAANVPWDAELLLAVPAGYVEAARAMIATGRAAACTPLQRYGAPDDAAAPLHPFAVGTLARAMVCCEIADELAEDGDRAGARWAVLAGAMIGHDPGLEDLLGHVVRRLIEAARMYGACGIGKVLRDHNTYGELDADDEAKISAIEHELPEAEHIWCPFDAPKTIAALIAAGDRAGLAKLCDPSVPLPARGWPYPAGLEFETVAAANPREVIVEARAGKLACWIPLVIGERGWRLRALALDRTPTPAALIARAAASDRDDDATLLSLVAAARERERATRSALEASRATLGLVHRWAEAARPIHDVLLAALIATRSRAMVSAACAAARAIEPSGAGMPMIVERLWSAGARREAHAVLASVVDDRIAELVAAVRTRGPSPDEAGHALAAIMLRLPRWLHEHAASAIQRAARDWTDEPESRTHVRRMGKIALDDLEQYGYATLSPTSYERDRDW